MRLKFIERFNIISYMKTKKYLALAEYSLPIEIQREDDGYVAKCPVWNDCFAQGDTIDEAINEISYVASSFFKIDFPLVVSAS